MRVRFVSLILCMIVGIVCVACTTQPNASVQEVAVPNMPTPTAGKSAVVGQVTTTTNQQPIGNMPVYLAQVYWDEQHTKAAFALDIARSPSATTDEKGFFTFNDIVPNEYVLVVGDFYGENDVVREGNGDARVFKPTADQLLNVGVVQVKPLPPYGQPAATATSK